MRRNDREVTEAKEIDGILERCDVCRLALAAGDVPYVVPLNYGFSRTGSILTLFFHCAKEGKKLDMLARNPRVCFEVDGAHRLAREDGHPEACTMEYESVIGWGVARILRDEAERRAALDRLIRHYGGTPPQEYAARALEAVEVFQVTVTSCTAKRHLKK